MTRFVDLAGVCLGLRDRYFGNPAIDIRAQGFAEQFPADLNDICPDVERRREFHAAIRAY
jgi:hypothetical protein